MVISAICFAGMAITIRMASEAGQHPFQIAFFRNFFGLLFALPLLARLSLAGMRTSRGSLYFYRCIVGLCAMLSGFWSLVHLPLAKAIALSYTTPLFVTIGAVIFLGEVVRMRRWSAIAIGFVGAMVIIRPGLIELNTAAMVALLSAVLSASAAISVKFLARTEPAEAIVIYMVLIMTPLSLFPALYYWQWPSLAAWLWLAVTGLLGTLGHIAMTEAYKRGDVSMLQPINFVQLPMVALLAWLLFSETVDSYTWFGAGIICAAIAYMGHREAVLKRRQITDAATAGEMVQR
jgi:drug/metabolite transporter (DMT)-like permease